VLDLNQAFDEGSMKGRPDLIKPEIEKVLAVMTDSPPIFSADDHPVLYTFQLIWQRILKVGRSAY
jgi:hypothetical protein